MKLQSALLTIGSIACTLATVVVTAITPPTLHCQPTVELDRSLEAAVREAAPIIDRGEYVLAITRLERALDSARVGSDRSEALLHVARARFLARRYSPAYDAATELLTVYPASAHAEQALSIAAVSAVESGRANLAEPAFWRLVETDGPRAAVAYYWLGRIHADRGQLDTALELVERSLDAESHEFTDDALFLSGWIHEGYDHIDRAAGAYRTILHDHPESDLRLDAQLRLGVIDARRGQYASAITLLQSLTPKSPRQREERLFYLGEASSAMGRHADALEYYSQHLREFPLSERMRQSRYGTGHALLSLQRWSQAITAFRYLEGGIDSLAAAATYQIAAIQVNQADTASAVRTLHSLLYRLPYESFSDNANYLLGRIHYRRENYDSARHYLLVTARQFPESEIRAEAYYLLAEAYRALDNYDNAQYNFARVRSVGATGELYYRSLYREGVMLYRLGRFYSGVNRLREYVADNPTGEDIAGATFWLAESLYQHRAYDEAEGFFKQHVERFPDDQWSDEALYGLAWSQFRQKEFKASAQSFERFLRLYPESDHAIEATIRLADNYRFLKQYDKAIATYESVGGRAGEGPRAEEARFRLAQALYEMGEIDRAIGHFRALIQYYPKSGYHDVYAFNIGQIYREKGYDSLAMVELQRFVVDYDGSMLMPQVLFTIGDLHYNAAIYDSAYYYYSQILQRHPTSGIIPDALDAVRFSLDAMGRGIEAVDVIDEFVRRNPDRIPADSLTQRKAVILFGQGDFPGAIAMYRSLIAEHPNSGLHPEALYQIGRIHSLSGARDSALAVYRIVVERFPESEAASDALVDRGNLLLRMAQPRAAAADFAAFIERFEATRRSTEARFGLGAAQLANGDSATARSTFDSLIALGAAEEDDIFVDRGRLARARLHVAAGDVESALDLLGVIVARRLDYLAAESLLLRGRLLLKRNDLSAALIELRRLTSEFVDYPEYADPGMLLLGELYETLTNTEAARQTYAELLERTEDPAMRTEAEARLRRMPRR